jgi:isohexenylglutaconyl-CoA hydratase
VNPLPDCKNLLLAREGSILRVTINRPETRNALTAEVVGELAAVADFATTDSTLRTLVLRGADRTFCAGGDIKGFRQSFEAPAPSAGERDPIAINNRKFGDFLIRFNQLPQTVVGVIEGAAFGGGLGLVCVTDIAICGTDTKFALSETGLGIPPAQIAPFVVQRVGFTTARRIALSGARFDGAHAKAIGLVHFAERDAAAIEARLTEILKQINRCAPGANAATKQIMLNSLRLPVGEVLDAAADAFARQLRGDEGREGVRAFLEKRPAAWVEPDA